MWTPGLPLPSRLHKQCTWRRRESLRKTLSYMPGTLSPPNLIGVFCDVKQGVVRTPNRANPRNISQMNYATHPFMHKSQDADSLFGCTEPAGHSLQLVFPSEYPNLPGSHLLHSLCPVALWLRPVAHFSQAVWPSRGCECPELHAVHVVVPGVSA